MGERSMLFLAPTKSLSASGMLSAVSCFTNSMEADLAAHLSLTSDIASSIRSPPMKTLCTADLLWYALALRVSVRASVPGRVMLRLQVLLQLTRGLPCEQRREFIVMMSSM